MAYCCFTACRVAARTLIRSVPKGPEGPCFSIIPKGRRQTPEDACKAFTKSAAVNSSHLGDSSCAEHRVTGSKQSSNTFFASLSNIGPPAYIGPTPGCHMQIRQLLQVNPDSDVNPDTTRTAGLPLGNAPEAGKRGQ